MSKLIILFALTILGVSSKPTRERIREGTCGYETCHPITDSSKITVHLIPHSHDDVGWLKTVDQYFYGAKTPIQRAGVQYIITTAVESLKRNPDRRYVQVESAFFKKWWNEARESLRQDFVELVNNGQIEMINGAVSMNDEACTNYQSTIDQYTWGLRFLNDTLGSCGIPKIGWQIDPFGHSREQASLFAQLGFNGFFFSRLDENDRKNRKANKRLDFLWQGSANLDNTELFGSIFPTSLYFPPNDLHWDVGDSDDPIIDNEDSPDYNVPKFLDSVKKTIAEYKQWFPTNNILFPMGGDFQYQSAEMQFINMDRLIKIFENNSDINIIYSTPSCYLKAVNDANPTLKLKTDDFFPYGNSDHEYWAGYFTSRPNSKRFERTGNNILQATKQLTALAKALKETDYTEDLDDLREEMGIMQHHDAITGTEKQHVTSDYVRRLTKGIRNAEAHLDEVLGSLLTKNESYPSLELRMKSCLMANVSICHTGEANNIIVVYNPLSRVVDQVIRVPVPEGEYKIIGPDSENVVFAKVEPISKFEYVEVDDGKPLPVELVIEVSQIPAFGAKVLVLEITSTKRKTKKTRKTTALKQLKFGTDSTGFELDASTNLLKSVTINGKTVQITQEFLYYQSSNESIYSGAYLFRPQKETVAISLSDKVTLETTNSNEVVDEVVQVFNEYIKQIIRVYKTEGQDYIEFDWLVGPLPDDTEEGVGMGREIITRFTVKDLDNKGIFYTDSNGRELIKRELNKRPDYEYNSTLEPIASNYYPVTSRILIRDEDKDLEVAVLNDRSQAGSSLNKGELELMVHRRLFHDDAKGVDENLNETEFNQGVVVRGSHYLTLGDLKSAPIQERVLALKKLLSPVVLVSSQRTVTDITKNFELTIQPLNNALPDAINILTFEPWTENSYILRLENIFEKSENPDTVNIDLNKIFTDLTFANIRETTLGANQWVDEYNQIPKFTWKSEDRQTEGWTVDTTKDEGSTFSLSPMQIRTFIVEV